MPELPEVETVRRGLRRTLVGKKIITIRIHETRLRYPVSPGRIKKWLLQQTFCDIERRAKYILCRMENDADLLLHLGMSGRLIWCSSDKPLEKHDHVQFIMEDATELRFRDPRRFGMFDAIAPGKRDRYKLFGHLGVEPLSKKFTSHMLFSSTRNRKKPIKNFLMDSTQIVGVGNIYANEALFQAAIHPEKPSYNLERQHCIKLVKSVKETLKSAIASGGTTLNDFYNSNGEMGYFQQKLKVYGREGEKCKRCKTIIRRMIQVGRSTFYCPVCQNID